MKIFAKRTKQKAVSETDNKTSDADKIVLELLKKDVSELNAKQRRLVRRYQERIAEEAPGDEKTKSEDTGSPESDKEIQNAQVVTTTTEENETTTEENEGSEEIQNPEEEKDPKEENYGSDSDSDSSVPSESDDDSEEEEAEKKDGDKKAAEIIKEEVMEEAEKKDGDNKKTEINKEKVMELLETLNSKQRRTLARQLKRDGDSALEAVHDEALRLKQELEDSKAEKAAPAEKAAAPAADESAKDKKRKRDWSHLTPEERMRREEQRKKQQEAAERRAKEANDPTLKKFKHPLNSERRRANKRKPRWQRKTDPSNPNEHDTSGFHMRKILKNTD